MGCANGLEAHRQRGGDADEQHGREPLRAGANNLKMAAEQHRCVICLSSPPHQPATVQGCSCGHEFW